MICNQKSVLIWSYRLNERMIFWYFLSPIFSATGQYSLFPVDPLCFLTSFGFTDNSKFSFEVISKYPITLVLFLFNISQLRNTTSSEIHQACRHTAKEIIPLNKTFLKQSKSFIWNGNIENKNIYYPTIMICSPYHDNLLINYKYLNNEFLIDFRSLSYSKIYLIFSFVNICIAIIWILNLLFKPHFSIPIHIMMSFLPILRALSDSLSAYFWELRKITDDLPAFQSFSSSFISFLFYFMFSFVTTLSFSGYCVLRINANFYEVLQIGISCLLFVGGITLSVHSSFFFKSIFPILLTSTGFMWYIKINTAYFATLIQLAQSNLQSTRMADRVRMVSNFTLASFSLIGLLIFVLAVSITLNMWPVVQISILEVFICLLECLDMYFYLVRNEYQGEFQSEFEESIKSRLLKDPSSYELVFLTEDQKDSI